MPDADLQERLRVVHGYQDVDLAVVEDVMRNHLDFASTIRSTLGR
ncbi:MAG: hypothetical protein ACHQNV_04690 [Vicinamibacteria bacterium]